MSESPPSSEVVLSASQIDTWLLCERKWAWSYIEKIKKSNVFATLGSEIHLILADWLEKGKSIDTKSEIGKIVLPGLKHLPAPGTPGLEIEKGFELQTAAAKYRGFKDMQFFDRALDIPVVADHKTTTDFKWAKTEDDLRTNTQAVIYAQDALKKYNAKEAELRWIYYRTRGAPGSHLVKLRVYGPQVSDEMAKIDETAKSIQQAYQEVKKATDLAPNPRACEAFGGCVYMELCNLSTSERMKALMAQETLADKLKKRNAEKNAEKNENASAVAAPAASSNVASLQDKIAARKEQGVNPPPVSASVAVSQTAEASAPKAAAPSTASSGSTDVVSAPRKPGRPPKVKTETVNTEETTNEPETSTALEPDGVRVTTRVAEKAGVNGAKNAPTEEQLLLELAVLARTLKGLYNISVEVKF